MPRSCPRRSTEIRKDGSLDDKAFILSRLTDIALADGALMDAESAIILDLAKQTRRARPRSPTQIIVGSAQSIGFRTDVKLNRMAEDIRRSMTLGIRLRAAEAVLAGLSRPPDAERV